MKKERPRRIAAVVGSMYGTNKYQAALREDVLDDSLQTISEALISLGDDFAFSLLGRSGKFKNRSAISLRNAIESLEAPPPDSVFLLYYYGHAEIALDGRCLLAFNELRSLKSPTPTTHKKCSLERLMEHIFEKNFEKVIVILDCCHSGAVATNLDGIGAEWALLSSTKAGIQFEDMYTNPFTQAIAQTLTDIDWRERAALPGDKFLTLEALAQETFRMVSKVNGLHPSLTGALKNFPIVPVTVRTSPELNLHAPKKSLYFKLFLIGKVLGASVDLKITLEKLKQEFTDEPSFKVADRTGGQVMISDDTIRNYMNIGRLLSMWEKTGEDEWKGYVTKQIDSEGGLFNKFLVDGVLKCLPEGVDEASLRKCSRDILRRDLEPTFLRIHKELQDKFGPWRKNIDKKHKRVIVRLLGYALVLKRASSDTYFPR